MALAGEAYGAWTEAFEDDLGSPEMWTQVTAHNVQADAETFGRAALFIGSDEELQGLELLQQKVAALVRRVRDARLHERDELAHHWIVDGLGRPLHAAPLTVQPSC